MIELTPEMLNAIMEAIVLPICGTIFGLIAGVLCMKYIFRA